MKVRKLESGEISKWYDQCLTKDFPVNEVKPLENIINLCNEGRYDIYLYEEYNQVQGYATIWKHNGFTTFLLDYLGVPEKLRNKGIGKIILADIRTRLCSEEGKYNISLILESETPEDKNDPENKIRERRIGFYKRNGFIELYEMGTCGVRFTTFSYKYPPDNIKQTMKEHKMIYGIEREDVIVPLEKGIKPPMPFWMKEE